MQSIHSLAGILRSLIGTNPTAESISTPPHLFTAIVKEVHNNSGIMGHNTTVSLLWQNKEMTAILETTVRKNERLLLQLTEEKDGLRYYKVLARSEEEANSHQVVWHTVTLPEGESTPAYVAVKEYRQNKQASGSPCLDLVIPTANFGFAGIRILSLKKPYSCCFLVEESSFGTILQNYVSKFLASSDEYPIVFKPYVVIRRQDYLGNRSVFDCKA